MQAVPLSGQNEAFKSIAAKSGLRPAIASWRRPQLARPISPARSIDQGALDNAWENDALSGDYTLEELAELYPGM